MPKRAMNVMEAEVNRVLQLGDSSIVPINWKVPRKVNKLPLIKILFDIKKIVKLDF